MKRFHFQTITKRLSEKRKCIQVLFGPRQVGKTTLIKQVLQETTTPHVFVSADNTAGLAETWLRNTWNQCRLEIKTKNYHDFILIVDEVQKIANWSEIVKKEWDNDTFNDIPLKLVLLGSSSLLIQQGLSESLAGRFETIYIPHWSYNEMKEAFGFSVEQYITYGGYPGSADFISDENRWRNYILHSLIDTTLSKDILMLTRVDKPILLQRLFDIGCSYSAQILSLTKIQGELQEKGNLTTLSNYLKLLDTAGLLCGLDKFSGSIIHQRASKPKFQVYNNALMNIQYEKNYESAKKDPTYWGRLSESAVGAHLLNYSKAENYKLYYWNENSREVDFVLQKGNKLVALEVKSGIKTTNEGMERFYKAFSPTTTYTIGTGGIPFEEFFLLNPIQLL